MIRCGQDGARITRDVPYDGAFAAPAKSPLD
jgi:hypothetical protein